VDGPARARYQYSSGPAAPGPWESFAVLTPQNVILSLKVAVVAVTVLLLSSLVALARGNYRLHGRINVVFFTLSLTAVLGLELCARVLIPGAFERYITSNAAMRQALSTHLWFSVPSTLLMPAMLYTGLKGLRTAHLSLAALFGVLWTGTFVTGIFFLPHDL
jgi:uncharacterized membrane protein YozB (DUF420 family)